MYAIIETGGKQYRVESGDVIYVEKLNAEVDEEVTFDNTMSREVTFSSIEEGSKVRVTYMGSIYKENQETTDKFTDTEMQIDGDDAKINVKILSLILMFPFFPLFA